MAGFVPDPRLLRLAGFLRRHGAWVTRLGGLLLVAVGLALATGAWNALVTWLRVTVGPGRPVRDRGTLPGSQAGRTSAIIDRSRVHRVVGTEVRLLVDAAGRPGG